MHIQVLKIILWFTKRIVNRPDISMVDRDGDDASRRPKNSLKIKRDYKPATLSSLTHKKAIGERMNHLDRIASVHAERKVPEAHKNPYRNLAFKCDRDLLRGETWRHAAKEADIDKVIPDVLYVNMDAIDAEMDTSKGLESHWRIFMKLGTPITKREIKRCQTVLRAMIAHDR